MGIPPETPRGGIPACGLERWSRYPDVVESLGEGLGETVGEHLENHQDETKKASRDWPGRHVVELDLRSLATLRIAYGVILLLDTLNRWTDLVAHYSDVGVLPRETLLEMGWYPSWFSVHMATESLLWLNVLFALQALAALALVVGHRTRLATAICWLLLISLHSRNQLVLNSGDVYLRVILFWMLFLPWGQLWSIDAKKGRTDLRWWMPQANLESRTVKSLACLAVILQICYVYWFAVLARNDPSWTVDYSAVTIALSLDQFLTPFGYFFRETFSAWLPTLAWLLILWELVGPFLLLFPLDRGQIRTLAIAGFVGMHLGLGLCLRLGLFAWIGALTPLVLLPTWFWVVPFKKLTKLLDRRFKFVEETPAIAKPVIPMALVLRESLFGFLVGYILLWNMGNEELTPQIRVPSHSLWIGQVLRIDQRWNMFSPKPMTDDGWFVIEAKRKDGSRTDLFAETDEVSWEKPKYVADTYKNQRWRKFMMNLWSSDHEQYREPYARHLARYWNRAGRGPREITEFRIYYMLERTNPDGTEQKPKKILLLQHKCFSQSSQS